MSVYSEIKKYLLVLVGFFCLVLWAHIVVLYLYNDAETYPITWGTVNIGIIGKFPSLDVLSVDTKIDNSSNDTVLHFLYRWVLKYSVKEKKIVWDLASCGLDKFPTVRCTLKQNALWSDGSSIGTADVVSTYAFFSENTRNDSMKNRLSLLEVEEDKGDLVFYFKTNDVSALDLLFLPIMKKRDITNFETSDISTFAFNGPYIFDHQDKQRSIILIKQNQYFKGDADSTHYFDQIRFGFWDNEEGVDDVIDSDIKLSDTALSAWKASKYIRPVLYSIFINSTSVPNTLRTAIFNDIFNTLQIEKTDALLPEENIFLGEIPNTPRKSIESLFFNAVFNLGYNFGWVAPQKAPETVQVAKIQDFQKPLKYFTTPSAVTPAFSSSETVELGGKVPSGTRRVVVNDYTLQNFTIGKKQFVYNAKKSFKNIVDGKNTYKVVFYGVGTKVIDQETLTLYYHSDTNELKKIQDEWLKSVTPAAVEKPPVVEVPAQNLDPKKLYKNNVPLRLTIVVQADVPLLDSVAQKISDKLQELGSETQILSMSVSDIKKNLQNPDFKYDIVLSGINLGLFHYNILPFFHSGQVKEGFNISRIRSTSLDTIMERISEQLYTSSPDKLRALETSAQKILEQEHVIFPLASPYEYIKSKDTVLGFTPPEFLPGREIFVDVLSNSYFKRGYKRTQEAKTFAWFSVWLKNELFSNI